MLFAQGATKGLYTRGRSKKGGGGGGIFFKKGGGGGWGGGGGQPLTREQFVLQIKKNLLKGGGGGGVRTPWTSPPGSAPVYREEGITTKFSINTWLKMMASWFCVAVKSSVVFGEHT